MKKRSFLLFEVLLAITILVLFTAPLIRWPIKHWRSQILQLERFEHQRIADYSFSEIKESLFKKAIPWDQLPRRGKSITVSLNDTRLSIPYLASRRVTRSYALKCLGEKHGAHGEIFRLYRVIVTLDKDNKFVYKTLIQRIED